MLLTKLLGPLEAQKWADLGVVLSYTGEGEVNLRLGTAVVPLNMDKSIVNACIKDNPHTLLLNAAKEAINQGLAELQKIHAIPPVDVPELSNPQKEGKVTKVIKLYEPVKSKTGKIYLVAAIWEGVRVSTTYKDYSLSVRVEGAINNHQEKLQKVGFSLKGQVPNKYASIHLDIPDKGQVAAAFGAILFSMGIHFSTPVPNPNLLFQ